jgi:hypothetical protein
MTTRSISTSTLTQLDQLDLPASPSYSSHHTNMQPTRVIPAPVYAPPSISALTRSSEPDPDTANLHNLIAHYLCTYYPAALPAFLSASGAADPATLPPPGVDLRTLVLDAASAARADELAAKLASTEINPGGKVPLDKLLAVPVRASLGPEKHAFPVAVANLLSVAVADVPFRSFDTATAAYVAGRKRCVLVSGADREVRVVDYASGEVSLNVPSLQAWMNGTELSTDILARLPRASRIKHLCSPSPCTPRNRDTSLQDPWTARRSCGTC